VLIRRENRRALSRRYQNDGIVKTTLKEKRNYDHIGASLPHLGNHPAPVLRRWWGLRHSHHPYGRYRADLYPHRVEQKEQWATWLPPGVSHRIHQNLFRYQVDWKNWKKVSATFIQMSDKTLNVHPETDETSLTRYCPSKVGPRARASSPPSPPKEALTNKPDQMDSPS